MAGRKGKPVPSHAPALPVDRGERVRECMAVMAAGRWQRGVTGNALRKLWGVSAEEMKLNSGEASRRLREHLTDEEFAAMCRGELWRLLEAAHEAEQVSAGVAAVKLLLESRGLLTKQHQIRVGPALTEEEMLAEMAQDPQFRTKLQAALGTVPALPPGKDEEDE